jgi:hypothetical protein
VIEQTRLISSEPHFRQLEPSGREVATGRSAAAGRLAILIDRSGARPLVNGISFNLIEFF